MSENGKIHHLLECYLQSELHRVMRLSMRLQEPAMFTVCSGVRPVGEANTGLTGPDMALKIVFRFLQGLMDSTKVFCIKYTLHHSNKVFLQHRLMILLLNFTFLLFHVQNILNILSN